MPDDHAHGERGPAGPAGPAGEQGPAGDAPSTIQKLEDISEKLDVQGKQLVLGGLLPLHRRVRLPFGGSSRGGVGMDVILRGQRALVEALTKAGVKLPAQLLVDKVSVEGQRLTMEALINPDDKDAVSLE